jgi:ankyrin repeat protein
MKKSQILKQAGAAALAGALMIGVVRAQTGSGAEGVPGLAGLLRDSLYEEEANRDLTKAAAGYEALLGAWSEVRPTAAAAMFRLAEVRRKQGRKEDAIGLYERLLREFPEMEVNVRLARENLAALGVRVAEGESGVGDVLLTKEEAEALLRVKKLHAESPDLLIGPEFTGACSSGWLAVVRFLVEKGVDDGGKGLELAAGNGHLAIVRELLKGKPSAAVLGSAVDVAAEKKRVAVLQLLLESGASADGSGGQRKPLTLAILSESGPATELLLERKADVKPAGALITPLYAAARRGNAALVRRLLALGADVNQGSDPVSLAPAMPGGPPVDWGYTGGPGSAALHGAVAAGCGECVQVLLEAKAKPDAADDDGLTPLLVAVENENLPVVERLLAAGADASLASKSGETPLLKAVSGQNAAMVEKLLAAGADANHANRNGQPPLLLAVKWDLGVARALLRAKADPNAIVADGVSVFGQVFGGQSEVDLTAWVQLFLEHGADPFLEAAPAVRYAPPEWRIKLLRSHRYPVLAGKAEVSLVYGNEAVERTLEVRKEETAAPGSLPELMMAWSLRASSGLGTAEGAIDWTTLRLWRKGGDGKMEETVIAVKDGIEWPVLQWGDVVEVLAPIAAAESLKPAGGPIGPGGRRRVVLPPSPPEGPPIPAATMELLKRAK